MELYRCRFYIRIFIFNYFILYAVADTRYECIVNLMSQGGVGGFGGYGGFGEADEFENEMGEMDEVEDGGGIGAVMRASGSLTCPQGNRGHILVKRVAYGTSMFGTTCRSDGYCKEEYDPADSVAARCDGKSSCFIDMLQPVVLQCGRTSTYMLVEYECVDSWTTFDVCQTVSTVARGSSVFLTSPGYLSSTAPTLTTGRQMCECIVQSQNAADIYMDYLQIQLASEGDTCPYEYVMVESKKNITASTIDKELQVCGRRHVGARWLKGSIRLSYASGGQMQRRGMIVKFTADNIGTAPRIELECGRVDSSRLTLKEAPASTAKALPRAPMFPFGGMNGAMMRGAMMNGALNAGAMNPGAMNPGAMNPGAMNFPPYPPSVFPPSAFPPMFPTSFPAANHSNFPFPPLFPSFMPPVPPIMGGPDFSNWKINLPNENKPTANAPSVAPVAPPQAPDGTAARPAPTPPPRSRGKKPAVKRGGRRPAGKRPAATGRKNRAGKVVDDGQTPGMDEEVTAVAQSGNGGMVGLVFGGIGAFLIVGSVGILAINNYRKRQRIKREEAEYYYGKSASSTYGQGWKKETTDEYESVYATVAEVETYRQGCVNPAVSPSEEEFKPVTTGKQTDRGKGKGGKGKKSSNQNAVYEDPEVRPSCSAKPDAEVNVKDKIAVIDVHRVAQEYIAVTYGNDLHSDGCIAANSYTSVKKSGANTCSECAIVRPPRRHESDYDNNIGLKNNTAE